MSDLKAALGLLADAYAGIEPAVLQIIGSREGALTMRAFDASGKPVATPNGIGVSDALGAVEDALVPDGTRAGSVIFELRWDDAKRMAFGHAFDLDSVSPARLVLDPDYRHPGHPRHPMPEPPGVAVTERPTDPAVLAMMRGLVAEFAAQYKRTRGWAPQFDEGYTEEEILAAERHLGLRLPEELRALYRIVHGDGDCDLLLGSQMLYPLQLVLDSDAPQAPHWHDDLFSRYAVVTEVWPPGRVKRVARSDWWLEIAIDGGGYGLAVDLDPGPDGTVGQLIEYGPGDDDLGYACASVSELLRRVIEGRDNRDGLAVRKEPTRVHLMKDGLTTRQIVDEEPAPDEVQRLFLNDGVEIDLAELVAFPRLRELSITRAGRVVGRLSADVPVEAIHVDADGYDLAAFAGHPKLWKLTVARGSVSVGALAVLPALVHLDLSGVEVSDIERLAELPGLRVLELDAAQWRRLRDADAVPKGLAAAALNGYTPLADAREWADLMRTRR